MKKILLLTLLVFYGSTLLICQDQGMTSETHKKNVGKILWAKERIKKDIQDQIKYETNFDVSDPLYGRIFLQKSLPRLSEGQGNNCYNNNSNFRLKLFVDGVDKGFFHQNYFPGGQTWTTAQINLTLAAGDNVDDVNMGVPEKWSEVLKELTNGKHEIKFEFFGGGSDECLKKFAEGSFTIDKSGEQVAVLLKKLPEALKKDTKLENEMIQVIKRLGWTNEYPIKVVIVEADWRIIRDVWGNILRKEINTNIILKKNDDTCRLTDISFAQPYQGGNKYGATEVFGYGLKNIPFDCSVVK
jgi:hypothetical protein